MKTCPKQEVFICIKTMKIMFLIRLTSRVKNYQSLKTHTRTYLPAAIFYIRLSDGAPELRDKGRWYSISTWHYRSTLLRDTFIWELFNLDNFTNRETNLSWNTLRNNWHLLISSHKINEEYFNQLNFSSNVTKNSKVKLTERCLLQMRE